MPADFGLLEQAVDFLVERCNPSIQIQKEIVEFADGLPGEVGEFVLSVCEDLRDHPSCPGDALAESEASIQQEPTDLTDDGGAMVHHPLARPMQRLDVLLLDALPRYKSHVGLAGRRADGLGIVAVVLLTPHERFSHIAD